jgi:hypothetical protein
VTADTGSPEAYIRHKAPGLFEGACVDLRINRGSPLALAPERIQAGDIPASYPLLEFPGMLSRPGTPQGLGAHLRANAVVDVCSCVVTVRDSSSGMPAVSLSDW